MVAGYRTYQFRISEKRRNEDDLKLATAEKMMGFLEEICQRGVRLRKDVDNLPVIGGEEVFYLVENAVVRNKTSGSSPYCETKIISYGKPTSNIVERYQEFYRSDPVVIHF